MKTILQGLCAQLILWVPTEIVLVFFYPEIDNNVVHWILFAGTLIIILITATVLTLELERQENNPRPVDFGESNHDWLKPDGMTDEECGSLPAYVDDEQSVSCWRMSFWDRLRLLLTGRIWVGVLASGRQPPIWITIKKPFQPEQKIKDTEDGKGQKETLSTR